MPDVPVVPVVEPVVDVDPVPPVLPVPLVEPPLVLPVLVPPVVLPVPELVPPLVVPVLLVDPVLLVEPELVPVVVPPLVVPDVVVAPTPLTRMVYGPGGSVATIAASRLPTCSGNAPTLEKSCDVASWVVNVSPFANVPVKVLVLPVVVVEPEPVVVPVLVEPVELPVPLVLPVPAVVPPLNIPQSLLDTNAWEPRYNVIDGFASGLETPSDANPGPTPRINTLRGCVPAMTNPTIVELFCVNIVRTDTLESGAANGISASENLPVVVVLPCAVVKVPAFLAVKTRFVVAAGVLPLAGREIVAVFGPVTT